MASKMKNYEEKNQRRNGIVKPAWLSEGKAAMIFAKKRANQRKALCKKDSMFSCLSGYGCSAGLLSGCLVSSPYRFFSRL